MSPIPDSCRMSRHEGDGFDVRLWNCSCERLIEFRRDVEPIVYSSILADPPWSYRNSGNEKSAAHHYKTITEREIAGHLAAAYDVAAVDAYLFVWFTFPKLQEWEDARRSVDWPWRFLTGGAWGKTGGFGMGFHHRGDAEGWLIYAKGKPKPAQGSWSNLALTPRLGHSEKPGGVIEKMAKMGGGPLLDLYAGEFAVGALAARRAGVVYDGAEIDLQRWQNAAQALEQGNLFTRSQATMRPVQEQMPGLQDPRNKS